MAQSFVEAGGDSITAMAEYLKLRREGKNIDMEEYLQGLLQKDHKENPSRTMKEISNNYHYVPEPLSAHDPALVQRLMAECFVTKENLLKGGNVPVEDFVYLLQQAWSNFQNLGFVLVDQERKIRGIALATDAVEMEEVMKRIQNSNPFLLDILMFFDSNREKAFPHSEEEKQSLVPGIIKAHVGLGTPIYNNAIENVAAMYLLVKHSHEDAKAKGYKMALAQNSSPITQQLAQMFGCHRLLESKPQEWTNAQGEKPFANCPDSVIVTVDLKEYD